MQTNLSKDSSLIDIQKHLDEVCRVKGWDKNTITEVFLLFSEEVGELAKSIRLETGLKNEKKPDDPDHLKKEIADVFNYLLELANRFDVDLADAYLQKHAINTNRSWN